MDQSITTEEKKEALWQRALESGMARRKFLALLAGSGAAAVLAACTPKVVPAPAPTPVPAPPQAATPPPTPRCSRPSG